MTQEEANEILNRTFEREGLKIVTMSLAGILINDAPRDDPMTLEEVTEYIRVWVETDFKNKGRIVNP